MMNADNTTYKVDFMQGFLASALDLLPPHVPAEVDMASNETRVAVGAVSPYKLIDIELTDKAFVFQGSKVLRQGLGGELLDTENHKARTVGQPLNRIFVLVFAVNVVEHFV
jgi:hypothetical protein